MSDLEFDVVEVGSLVMEGGAKELMSALEMQPYLRYSKRHGLVPQAWSALAAHPAKSAL